MKTIMIYGSSDDLIELDGDIHEEMSPDNEDESTILSFSDGTVLSVVYDEEGCWRINRIAKGMAKMNKIDAEGPDSEHYSDRVTLTGEIKWCVSGKTIIRVH